MGLKNTAATLFQLGKSIVETGVDALPVANPLPLEDSEIAGAEFMNAFLKEYGIDGYQNVHSVSDVQLTDIQSISSNCNNRVIALQYDEQGAHELPATMFLKMPVQSLTTRIFFNVIMSWELECQFYRMMADRMPVRVPKPYALANKGSRFVMLMEDLNADPTVVLHNNLEMMEGPSIEKVRTCIGTMAKFHAKFHGINAKDREALLPQRLQPFMAPVMKAMSPMMATTALKSCIKRDDVELSEEHIATYKRAVKNWDRLVDYWTQEPLTLVHGDSHLGNHFLHEGGAGMLDWQAAQWAKGVRDVQYFLTDSLPADVLAENEEELVRYYHELLAEEGVDTTFEELWHQYRGYSFQTWMTIIVSIGFGAMTDDMDDLMPEIHRRCIASIERLDLAGWLDEVLG